MPITPNEANQFKKDKIKQAGDSLIPTIDREIAEYDFEEYPWISIVLNYYANSEVRDYIAGQYIKAGWYRVIHFDSAEVDPDRPSIIEFVFCTKETYEKWENCHKNISKYRIICSGED